MINLMVGTPRHFQCLSLSINKIYLIFYTLTSKQQLFLSLFFETLSHISNVFHFLCSVNILTVLYSDSYWMIHILLCTRTVGLTKRLFSETMSVLTSQINYRNKNTYVKFVTSRSKHRVRMRKHPHPHLTRFETRFKRYSMLTNNNLQTSVKDTNCIFQQNIKLTIHLVLCLFTSQSILHLLITCANLMSGCQ